jgi:hypothetical protein
LEQEILLAKLARLYSKYTFNYYKECNMPLLPGKKNIGNNIREMENAGHPYNQARAAALNKAYGKKKKKRKAKKNQKEKTGKNE